MTTQKSRMLLFWVTVVVVGGVIGTLFILRGRDDVIVRVAVAAPLVAGAIFLLTSRIIYEDSPGVPPAEKAAVERRGRQAMRNALASVSLMAASAFVADERLQLVLMTCALVVTLIGVLKMRWSSSS